MVGDVRGAGQECRCSCGAARLHSSTAPFARFLCHCQVCQRVYRRGYGEPAVIWRSQVSIADASAIEFVRQRSRPFSVLCGTCRGCREPIVGFSQVLPFLWLAYVPAARFADPSVLPPASCHIFYGSRVADLNDALPKHDGFLASQIAVARLVMRGIFAAPSRDRMVGQGASVGIPVDRAPR